MNELILILLGGLYLIMGLGMILNKKLYKQLYEKMINSGYWLVVMGILAYLIGAGIILLNYHNPDPVYKIIYFVIGCLAILKGGMFMISPNCMIKLTNFFLQKINIVGYFVVIVGVLLIGIGIYL